VWACVRGALNVETPLNGSHSAEFMEDVGITRVNLELLIDFFIY